MKTNTFNYTLKAFKRGTLCLLVALSCFTNGYAGPRDTSTVKMKVYHNCKPLTISIIGIGAFSDYFAIGRIKGKAEITSAELSALNPGLLHPIDRWALNQASPNIALYSKLSDNFQIPVFMLPGLLLFNRNIRKDWFDILLMYVEGHVVTFTFYNYSWLGPTFQNKYRPVTYYTELPMGDRTTGNNRNSFYSGHVASVAYASFFTAKIYCDYHPELGGKQLLIYAAASVPPLIEGYLRVRSLAHFPSDAMVGLFLGASIGIAIPELHKIKNQNIKLGLFSTGGASGMSLLWTIPQQHSITLK
jgi:membrane-associated phospholipid phosphatase